MFLLFFTWLNNSFFFQRQIRIFPLFHLDNTSNDDKYSTINYPYNLPSIYLSTKNQTPKLYTIVNILRRAQLQKQEAIRQQNSNEAENEAEVDDFSQVWNMIYFWIFIFLFFCLLDINIPIATSWHSKFRNSSEILCKYA